MNRFHALAAGGGLLALGVASAALIAPDTTTAPVFYGCAKADGSLDAASLRQGIAPSCKRGYAVVSWNSEGPQGPDGVQGEVGPQGPQGIQGPPGERGPAGVGGLHWVADDGTVVGTPVNDSGRVLVTIGTQRLFAQVQPTSNGLSTFSPIGIWAQPGFTAPALHYFESNDCSGTPYYGVMFAAAYGQTAPAQLDYENGDTWLLQLDGGAAQQRNIQCIDTGSGPAPGNYGLILTAPLVTAHALDLLFPPPLTLQ